MKSKPSWNGRTPSCDAGLWMSSDAGFADCGFDSRALGLKFRSSNCLNKSGLRENATSSPGWPHATLVSKRK